MLRDVRKIALALYQANGTPRSLSCYMLLKYGELRQLVSLAVNPNDYIDTDKFFRDSSSTNFLKKIQLDVGIDRRGAALETFLESERENTVINERLRRLRWSLDEAFVTQGYDAVYLEVVIRRMRHYIRKTLGPIPERLEPAFGPGATYDDRGRATTVAHKMSSNPTCTEEAWSLVNVLWDDSWRRTFETRSTSCLPTFVRGNRFLTVPKTATTDRPICVEPSLNMYFQKSVGAYIGEKLTRVGLDIKTGQDRHRVLLSTSADSLSTIDLSSASDTITTEFVKLVLPEDWFYLLDVLRCRRTLIDGRWIRQEKFSSMGNGFTFELETLLFSAIVWAMDPSQKPGVDFSVYGDDIILAPTLFDDTKMALKFFGFTTNDKKSFKQGPFKESCGFDVFNGQPTRSFYLKKVPCEPIHYFTILNGLRNMADRYSGDYRVYDLYRRPWLRAMDGLPIRYRRMTGPSFLGDSVIYDREAVGRSRRNDPGKRFFEVLVSKPVKVPLKTFSRDVQMSSVLYASQSCSGGFVTLRGETDYRIGTVCG